MHPTNPSATPAQIDRIANLAVIVDSSSNQTCPQQTNLATGCCLQPPHRVVCRPAAGWSSGAPQSRVEREADGPLLPLPVNQTATPVVAGPSSTTHTIAFRPDLSSPNRCGLPGTPRGRSGRIPMDRIGAQGKKTGLAIVRSQSGLPMQRGRSLGRCLDGEQGPDRSGCLPSGLFPAAVRRAALQFTTAWCPEGVRPCGGAWGGGHFLW